MLTFAFISACLISFGLGLFITRAYLFIMVSMTRSGIGVNYIRLNGEIARVRNGCFDPALEDPAAFD